MPKKKGQFFIISAVVILLVLFNLSGDMATEWKTDVSGEQANDVKIIFGNIQNGINSTIQISNHSTETLRESLQNFAIAQKNSMRDRYSVDIHYNISETSVRSNVTLKSTDTYVEKTISMPR